MNNFRPKLHDIVKGRCDDLGIRLITGSRVKLPADGYPTDGSSFNVVLEDGSQIPSDLAVNHPSRRLGISLTSV